jgi:Cu/Ag efflux pump CusA
VVLVLIMLLALVAAAFLMPVVGRHLLPELEPEQPNLFIHGTMPLKVSPEREQGILREARSIIATYPEVENLYSTNRLLDERGRKTAGYHVFVELRPNDLWPELVVERGRARPRTRAEFIEALKAGLESKLPAISWTFEPAGTITFLDAPRTRPRLPTRDSSGQELPTLDRLKALVDQINEINDEPD